MMSDSDDLDLSWRRAINQVVAAGVGIAGANVEMRYHPLLCSSASRTKVNATTDANGRYREVFAVVADDAGCLRLRIGASGFMPDSATRLDGVFRRQMPFDSVQTNFTLRAR